ncbi:23939_t:CDS:1, partial [Dentiscutata erythropus]
RRIIVLEAELEEIHFWDAELVEEGWRRDKEHWRVVQEKNQLWVQVAELESRIDSVAIDLDVEFDL